MSEGYERRLRAKRVMVVFNDTPMEEGSGVFFLTAHFVIPVSSLTPMEEGSGVFFLTLLTSSSLCSHSYGGRFWSVLPHTAHFVIPVFSLLWRKVLECSSSYCSLRHPCVLTHFVIPVISLTSSSLCPHSLRHPWVLTPMTCLLTHLIVIPDFSLESSHPSHP